MLKQTLLICAIIKLITGENQFMTAVRNLTNSNNNSNNQTKRNSNDDNVLQSEVSKYLNECKSDASNDFTYETEQRDSNHRYREKNDRNDESSGTYTDYYRESPSYEYNNEGKSNHRSGNFDDRNIDSFLSNYRNDQNHNRQRNYCPEGGNPNRRENNYSRHNTGNGRTKEAFDMNYPQENSRNPYDQNNQNYGSEYSSNQDSNSEMTRSRNHGNYNTERMGNYPREGDLIRGKRESENCISQCIFGYMELLDENNMPSETATIKFLQDRMQNDRKRLKLVRETRRCFAKLATTESEDSCEFSKILAKCLKLNTD